MYRAVDDQGKNYNNSPIYLSKEAGMANISGTSVDGNSRSVPVRSQSRLETFQAPLSTAAQYRGINSTPFLA